MSDLHSHYMSSTNRFVCMQDCPTCIAIRAQAFKEAAGETERFCSDVYGVIPPLAKCLVAAILALAEKKEGES